MSGASQAKLIAPPVPQPLPAEPIRYVHHWPQGALWSSDAATEARPERESVTVGHDFSRIDVHPGLPVQVQAHLVVGQPGDRYEEEADRAANAVVGHAEPTQLPELASDTTGSVRRQPENEDEEDERKNAEEDEVIQARALTGQVPQVTPGLARQIDGTSSEGSPIPTAQRTFYEQRFGHDFGAVRVYTGPRAAAAARSVGAQAFTRGHEIYFGAGDYQPETPGGRWLMAHELAHTIQQRPGVISRQPLAEPAMAEAPESEPAQGRTDIEDIVREAMSLLESEPTDQSRRLRERLDALDPSTRLAVLSHLRANASSLQRTQLDALLEGGARSAPRPTARLEPGPTTKAETRAEASSTSGNTRLDASRAELAQPVPAAAPVASLRSQPPLERPTPSAPAAEAPALTAATRAAAQAPAKQAARAAGATKAAEAGTSTMRAAVSSSAEAEGEAAAGEQGAGERLLSLAGLIEPLPESPQGATSGNEPPPIVPLSAAGFDVGPEAMTPPAGPGEFVGPGMEPIDTQSLMAEVTNAPVEVEAGLQTQAAAVSDSVRGQGRTVAASIRRQVERTASEIRKEFETQRTAVSSAVATARVQIEIKLLVRQAELLKKGVEGRGRIEAIFRNHRTTIQRTVSDNIAAGENLRTVYANRARQQTAEKALTARKKGARRAASYPATERGEVQSDATAAVAERTAREVEGKQPETLQAIDDVVKSIPEEFRKKGAEVLDGYDRPLPELLGQVDELVRAASEHLNQVAAGARTELENVERDLKAQLDAAETAVMQRIELFASSAETQIGGATRSAVRAINAAVPGTMKLLSPVAQEAAGILSQTQTPHPQRARAFTDGVTGYIRGAGEQSAIAFQEAGQIANDRLQSATANGATSLQAARGQVKTQLDGIAEQRDTGLTRVTEQVDQEYGKAIIAFDDGIAAMEKAVHDGLDPAIPKLQGEFTSLLQKSDAEAAKALADGMKKNDEALDLLDGTMSEAADDAAWDYDHYILARARNVVSFIAGLVVSIVTVLAKVVGLILLIVVVVVGIFGATLATALLVAAVIGVGLLAYGVIQGTRARLAQDQDLGSAILGGVGDVTGVTAIYRGITAEGLTPYERGNLVGEGGTTLILTVVGARELISRYGSPPRLPNPEGAAAGMGQPVVSAEPTAPVAAEPVTPSLAAPEPAPTVPTEPVIPRVATPEPAAPAGSVRGLPSEPQPQLSPPSGQLSSVPLEPTPQASPPPSPPTRVLPGEGGPTPPARATTPAVPRPTTAEPATRPPLRSVPSEQTPQPTPPLRPPLRVIQGEGRPAPRPTSLEPPRPQVQEQQVPKAIGAPEGYTLRPLEPVGGRRLGVIEGGAGQPGAPGGRSPLNVQASGTRGGTGSRSGAGEGARVPAPSAPARAPRSEGGGGRPPRRPQQPEGPEQPSRGSSSEEIQEAMKETIEEQELTIRGGGERDLPVGEADPTTQTRAPSPRTGRPPSPSPGPVPEPFERGNFVHRFAEYILRRRLPAHSEAEVTVRVDSVTPDVIRIDRLSRGHGDAPGQVIEIRPRGRWAQRMQERMAGRVQAVQREIPHRAGYRPRVVTYTARDVLSYLIQVEGMPRANALEVMKVFGFDVAGL